VKVRISIYIPVKIYQELKMQPLNNTILTTVNKYNNNYKYINTYSKYNNIERVII